MGRKSTKEDKNLWQKSREAAGMTRAEAAEAMGFVSESRIEKYESGRSPVQPEEVLAMSKAYRMPALCNQYCAHECPIGKEMVPEVRAGSLSQIVLETLAKVNALEREEKRFIEITADGTISPEEMEDFARIEADIRAIKMAADSLSLWLQDTIASGKIDEKELERARAAVRAGRLGRKEDYFAKPEK